MEQEIKNVTQEIQVLQGRKQKLLAKRDKLKDAIQQQRSAELAERDWKRQGLVNTLLNAAVGVQNHSNLMILAF